MAEGNGGLHSLLSKETAGLPNWAWLLVVGAGLAAAYLLPKFIGGGKSGAKDQSDASTLGGADTSGINNQNSGIGLAVDPTTGLPYAVTGLVPSGTTPTQQPPTQQPPTQQPPTQQPPTQQPPKNTPEKWLTLPKWPNHDGYHFSDVASKYGVSLDRLLQLNPQINKNAELKPGWTIRIA